VIQFSKKRLVVVVFLVGVLLLVRFSLLPSIVSLEVVQTQAHTLSQHVDTHYVAAVAVYLLFFICASAFLIPVTVLLTILGGYLFGVLFGTLYALLGATLGGCITFLFVRYYISGFIQKIFRKRLELFNAEVALYGSRYMLMLQLLPATPTPLINLIAGVSQISLFQFLWTTALGILPGTFLFAWAGTEVHMLESTSGLIGWQAILFLLFLSGLVLLSIFGRRLYRLLRAKNR